MAFSTTESLASARRMIEAMCKSVDQIEIDNEQLAKENDCKLDEDSDKNIPLWLLKNNCFHFAVFAIYTFLKFNFWACKIETFWSTRIPSLANSSGYLEGKKVLLS